MTLIADIFRSFRRLPLWVQIWVFGVLVPVNMAALAFVLRPGGWLIAALAVGGMAPNLVTMIYQRGFSKLMALPHLIGWSPLVLILVVALLNEEESGCGGYLAALLVVNATSLVFDFKDFAAWLKGDRAIA